MGEGDLYVQIRLDGTIDERIELRVVERAPPGGEVLLGRGGRRRLGARGGGGRGIGRRFRRKLRRRIRRGGVIIRAGRAADQGDGQREEPRSGELANGATATHGSFPKICASDCDHELREGFFESDFSHYRDVASVLSNRD